MAKRFMVVAEVKQEPEVSMSLEGAPALRPGDRHAGVVLDAESRTVVGAGGGQGSVTSNVDISKLIIDTRKRG